MLIALGSLNQFWLDKNKNLVRCDYLISRAKSAGCDIIIFPEMTLTGYSSSVEITSECEDYSFTLFAFRMLAKKYQINIIFGATLRRSEGFVNAFCIATPNTGSRAVYYKMHPFSYAGENDKFMAGGQLGYFRLGQNNLGASVCYDLRFPIPFSLMASACSGIVCIANWPQARVSHWRTLLTARAIENQLFMIGVNRIGEDGNGLAYEKSSVIVSPEGEALTPVQSALEMDVYDVDFAMTVKARQSFPTLRDAKFELYRQLF